MANSCLRYLHLLLLFSSLSDDRSKASSKTIPPHSAIQSLLLQMRVSSPVLKVLTVYHSLKEFISY